MDVDTKNDARLGAERGASSNEAWEAIERIANAIGSTNTHSLIGGVPAGKLMVHVDTVREALRASPTAGDEERANAIMEEVAETFGWSNAHPTDAPKLEELHRIVFRHLSRSRDAVAGDAQPEPIPDVLRGIRIRPEDTTAAPAATPLDNGAHPPRTETTTI